MTEEGGRMTEGFEFGMGKAIEAQGIKVQGARHKVQGWTMILSPFALSPEPFAYI